MRFCRETADSGSCCLPARQNTAERLREILHCWPCLLSAVCGSRRKCGKSQQAKEKHLKLETRQQEQGDWTKRETTAKCVPTDGTQVSWADNGSLDCWWLASLKAYPPWRKGGETSSQRDEGRDMKWPGNSKRERDGLIYHHRTTWPQP